MQLTFANIVIAQEFSDGGTDTVTGFKPTGKVNTQKAEFMRVPYAQMFARGNRVITMTGTIQPAPAPTLQATMLALETFYGSLPDTGDLVKTVSGVSATYPGAVLETCEVMSDLNGISYGFRLTFLAGKPSSYNPSTDAPITDPGGAPITDPSGVPITDP